MTTNEQNLTRLRAHPVIQAASEEMAIDIHAQTQGTSAAIEERGIDGLARVFLCILTDPTRPASRDAMVRIGIEHDRRWVAEQYDRGGRLGLRWYPGGPGMRGHVIAARDEDDAHRKSNDRMLLYWHQLRDNPEALVAALVEALDA